MAEMKSYFEVTPAELRTRPSLRNFGPFTKVRQVRFSWFNWFWIGDATGSNHKIAVGPFRTRWGAKRAWNRVPVLSEGERYDELQTHTRSLSSKFPN